MNWPNTCILQLHLIFSRNPETSFCAKLPSVQKQIQLFHSDILHGMKLGNIPLKDIKSITKASHCSCFIDFVCVSVPFLLIFLLFLLKEHLVKRNL